jgi:hypothetical protein
MHLSSEIALDQLAGRLPDDQKAFWNRHLELCMECTAELGRWRELEIGLRRSHLRSASEESVKSALEIGSSQRNESGSTGRSVIAAITFDSFFEPALAGVRGASAAARQLVMRAEEFDIHIKIWGEAEHRQLLGQLLPRSGANFAETANLHLLQHGERLESATADRTGEFQFTDLPEGDLSLQIDLPHLTVIGALNFRETH